jgi:hypothetical protein
MDRLPARLSRRFPRISIPPPAADRKTAKEGGTMNIPKYWAKSETTAAGPSKKYFIRRWDGSDLSVADAQARAEARVQETARKIAQGLPLDRYGYCDRPLREEVKEAVMNRFRDEVGLVTRNAYGALVLNAVGAMFVDIDIPGIRKPQKGGLFGGRKETFSLDPYLPSVRDVEAWAGKHPEYGIRIYATFAGLRCLILNTVFQPKSDHAVGILQDLKSDPLYTRLCKAQECFRARLTAKPWRCGLSQPPGRLRYPWASPDLEAEYRQWEMQYDAAAEKYAACVLVKQIGARAVHPDVESVLEFHDRATRAESGLPLA